MKVLYITDALAVWGGIERVLSDKMNYLVDYGYDVYVVTSVPRRSSDTIPSK